MSDRVMKELTPKEDFHQTIENSHGISVVGTI